MENWTVADFITYTYQLVADSDFETENKEIQVVKTRLQQFLKTTLGIENYSYEQSLKKIQSTEGVSLFNCKEVLTKLMHEFDYLKDYKKEILRDLEEIAASNDIITPSEKETVNYIRQVFSTVDMPLSW